MIVDLPFRRIVVVGGGAVGDLLVRTLQAAGATSLTIVDSRSLSGTPSGVHVLQDDIRQPGATTLAAVERSDLVILSTPETVAVEAAPDLVAHMDADALLVDTLSVKSPMAAALAQVSTQTELLGINPMFAPSLGFAGNGILAVPYAEGTRAATFLAVLAAQGSRIVSLSAAEHDKVCAALQAATHAAILSFGMALKASGYQTSTAESIMPPPHRMMLALLARLLSADPEVYRDIQAANPFAPEMRLRLLEANIQLGKTVDSGNPKEFQQLLLGLNAIFEGANTDYPGFCADLFSIHPE